MNEENVKRILDMVQAGITALSQQMGVTAPHLWEVLVRQQYVDALGSILYCLLLIPVFFVVRRIYKWGEKEKAANHYSDAPLTAQICMVAYAGVVVVGSFLLVSAIQTLVNPEYYAIQDIVKAVQQGK